MNVRGSKEIIICVSTVGGVSFQLLPNPTSYTLLANTVVLVLASNQAKSIVHHLQAD